MTETMLVPLHAIKIADDAFIARRTLTTDCPHECLLHILLLDDNNVAHAVAACDRNMLLYLKEAIDARLVQQ